MATVIDVQNLSLNPKEQGDFAKFIMELTFQKPELRAMHQVFTGVTMQEQIVLASQLGLTGMKANGCERQSSGANSVLSQKYWNPVGIEDTFETCQAEVDGLFKAYFDKIKNYREKYDITGSDEQLFIAKLVEESMNETINRAIWFGDTDVTASGSGSAGLIDGNNAYAFNYFDGIFKQIFDGVTAGTITKIDLSGVTPTAAEAYKAIFDVYKAADSRVRGNLDAKFYVSGKIFLGLMEYLQTESVNFTLDYTLEGFPVIKFLGHDVINMEGIWDRNLEYFEGDADTHEAYLPNRIVFTIPSNIPVATLNEDDMKTLESWYNIDERVNKVAYGFTLDAKVIDEKLITVAY